jgi:hypothetical protein
MPGAHPAGAGVGTSIQAADAAWMASHPHQGVRVAFMFTPENAL